MPKGLDQHIQKERALLKEFKDHLLIQAPYIYVESLPQDIEDFLRSRWKEFYTPPKK